MRLTFGFSDIPKSSEYLRKLGGKQIDSNRVIAFRLCLAQGGEIPKCQSHEWISYSGLHLMRRKVDWRQNKFETS